MNTTTTHRFPVEAVVWVDGRNGTFTEGMVVGHSLGDQVTIVWVWESTMLHVTGQRAYIRTSSLKGGPGWE